MSLVLNSIAVFICFSSVKICYTRSQPSVKYSHAINDCFHLCFGIVSCIDDCQMGYSSGRGQRRGRPRQPYAYENNDYVNPVGYYGSKALQEAVPSSSTKTKKVNNFSLTKLSQPKHCGLRYIEKKLRGSGVRGMGRIVGGEDADPHEFPWLVSLQFKINNGTKHFCGASIISEYYILTAAHCTDSLRGKEENVVVVAGITGIKEKGQVVDIEKFIVHDGWNADRQLNDISLIRLKKPIRFATNNLGQYMVNAVCLPPDSSEPNGYAQLAGWGQQAEDDENGSRWLQKITLPIWDRNKCRVNYRDYMKIQKLHICAGGRGGQDSCMGDSGGPLTQTRGIKTYQIGLVSFGIPCAIKGLPGVYTHLVYFMDWIKNNMI